MCRCLRELGNWNAFGSSPNDEDLKYKNKITKHSGKRRQNVENIFRWTSFSHERSLSIIQNEIISISME